LLTVYGKLNFSLRHNRSTFNKLAQPDAAALLIRVLAPLYRPTATSDMCHMGKFEVEKPGP